MKTYKQQALGTAWLVSLFFFSPFFAHVAHAAGESWYNTAWTYRKKITFTSDAAKIPSTLTNFSALISIMDIDVKDRAQSDADDILFTSSDGTTKLSHEIERYVSVSGELVVWVKIPSLSTSTVIYMYYGNAAATSQQDKTNSWDGHYYDVYHLAEASGNVMDSALGINGTPAAGVTQNAIGQIGSGMTFNGTSGNVNLGNAPGLDFRNSVTFEAWIKTANPSSQQTIVARSTSSVDIQYLFGISSGPSNSKLGFQSQLNAGYANVSSDTALLANTWYHAAVTFDGANVKFYLNGVLDGSSANSGTMNPQSTDTYIGKKLNDVYYFNGTLDEIRFSVSARSADWIKANYQNQSNPSAFLTSAAEEIYSMNITGTATQTAGSPQAVTLTARDYAGSTITAFGGDKSITFSGANAAPNGANPTCTDKYGTATNFGSATLITFTNGVATCNLNLYKAENATVTFTATNVFSRGSLAIVVSGAALNNFLVDAPATGTSTVPFSATVTSRDVYHNPTKQVSGNTTLSLSEQSATISPTSLEASQFTDDGVWTGNLTITNPTAGLSMIVLATNVAASGSDVILLSPAPATSPATTPNIPTNVATSNVTATQMTVSWNANGNGTSTEYFAENVTLGVPSNWITATSWTNTGLTCGTSYSFRVKARNGVSLESAFISPSIFSTTVCPVGTSTVPTTPGTTTPVVGTTTPPVGTTTPVVDTTAGTTTEVGTTTLLFKDIGALKNADQKNIIHITEFMLTQKTFKMPKDKKYRPRNFAKGLFALQTANALAEIGCGSKKAYGGKTKCKKAAVKAGLVKDKFSLEKKAVRLDMYELLLKARGVTLETADPDDLTTVCEDEKKATKREASIFFTARKYKIARKYKGNSCKLDKGFSKVEAAYFATKAQAIEKKKPPA